MPGDPVGSMKTTHPHTSHRSSTYTSLRMRLSIVTTLLGTAAAGTTALGRCLLLRAALGLALSALLACKQMTSEHHILRIDKCDRNTVD